MVIVIWDDDGNIERLGIYRVFILVLYRLFK